MGLFERTGDANNTVIQRVKVYAPILSNSNADDLLPLFDQVENDIISDYISDAEYSEIETAFQAASGTTEQNVLIGLCQKATAWLGLLAYADTGNLQLTSGGFTVAVGEDRAPASQWRIENFKHQAAKYGYQALQEILQYLWSTDGDGDFPDWELSTSHDKYRELFLLTASEMQESIDIDNSYQIFDDLRPNIKLVMRYHIKPITGADLYDELITQQKADTISSDNENLMELIRPCVAYYAMANGAVRLSVLLKNYGIIDRSTGDRENMVLDSPAPGSKVQHLINEWKRNGQLYENELRNYLKSNASTYPLYMNSDAYEDPDEDEDDGDEINDASSAFFVFR